MKAKLALGALLTVGALTLGGCGNGEVTGNANTAGGGAPAAPPGRKEAAPLPDNGFRAQLTLTGAPAKMRPGQKETVQVKVRNASDTKWHARGGELNTVADNKFYLAVGNRWLKAEGEEMVTNMDGRYGLPKDLQPGEEVEVPLQITAPKEPGDYVLEVDLIQEQVAWFRDKGSPTAKVKVTVAR